MILYLSNIIYAFVIQVFLKFKQLGSSIPKTKTLDPICSNLITCNHAHPQLWIDDSYQIIATDEGNKQSLHM